MDRSTLFLSKKDGEVLQMVIKSFAVGDIVEMKKEHPCGSKLWKVQRTGADIRIECQGCRHSVMIPRVKFEKNLKRVVTPAGSDTTGS